MPGHYGKMKPGGGMKKNGAKAKKQAATAIAMKKAGKKPKRRMGLFSLAGVARPADILARGK